MSLDGNATAKNVIKGKVIMPDMIHGKSAYEIAVINGFSGTEQEWLKSLKGEKGDNGKDAVTDQTYSATSENAQSGKAVAEVLETCVKKVDGNTATEQVYGVDLYGDEKMFTVENQAQLMVGNSEGYGEIPLRKDDGNLMTNTPTYKLDCTNKEYVDKEIDNCVLKQKTNDHTDQAYVVNSVGQQTVIEIEDNGMYEAGANNFSYSIPRRTWNGNLLTLTPATDLECANKKYVDDAVANAGGSVALDSYYTKSEIDSIVGDIETLLGGI